MIEHCDCDRVCADREAGRVLLGEARTALDLSLREVRGLEPLIFLSSSDVAMAAFRARLATLEDLIARIDAVLG
jgi:hypothetical protein